MSIISESERDGAIRGSGNFQQKIIRDYSFCKKAQVVLFLENSKDYVHRARVAQVVRARH